MSQEITAPLQRYTPLLSSQGLLYKEAARRYAHRAALKKV